LVEKMSKIRIIDSETELDKEVQRSFQYNLDIEQKSFYFDEGAEKYYDKIPKKNVNRYNRTITNLGNTIIKKCFKKEKTINFISLGCGNGKVEKQLLKEIEKKEYKIKYYGIDSSMTMIQTIIKNYEKEKFETQFIYADFSSEKFKNELNHIINRNKKNIFAFLGGTIGNVPQQYIANTLRNTLNKGDILWIGAQAQSELTDKIANNYFKKYLNRINDTKSLDFLKYPLKKKNINLKKGKIILEMVREKSIKTLMFRYGFLVDENINFKNGNEKFTLLNGDIIKLQTHRVYELKSLINFFEKREFKLIAYEAEDETLQIAFEKQ